MPELDPTTTPDHPEPCPDGTSPGVADETTGGPTQRTQPGNDTPPRGQPADCYLCQMGDPHTVHRTASDHFGNPPVSEPADEPDEPADEPATAAHSSEVAQLAAELKAAAQEAQEALAGLTRQGAGIDPTGEIMMRVAVLVQCLLGGIDQPNRLRYEIALQKAFARMANEAAAGVARKRLTQGLTLPPNGGRRPGSSPFGG